MGMKKLLLLLLFIPLVSFGQTEALKFLYYPENDDIETSFEHGQGGKMMFNFADRDYTWETFEKDRNYMFKKYLNN